MYAALHPASIGIRHLDLTEELVLARETGFAGLVIDIREATRLAEAWGIDGLQARFAAAGVRPAAWTVPGADASGGEAQAELARLPRYADVAQALGCPRATTFLPSGSDDGSYDEQFARAVARLRPFAAALAAEGCAFGLEFCGPKTFRDTFRYPFISTLRGARALGQAIGTGNVGVLLDVWHLYTSGGSVADLDDVTADEIVVVHVNDAVAGVPIDEQEDEVRMLPLATGVVPIVPVMQRLRQLGYVGPVVPEPFNAALEQLAARDPAAATQETARSMQALWDAAGLTPVDGAVD
jgi:sugar phosphate isomerase/epimerase